MPMVEAVAVVGPQAMRAQRHYVRLARPVKGRRLKRMVAVPWAEEAPICWMGVEAVVVQQMVEAVEQPEE